jgi:hypothetical protein
MTLTEFYKAAFPVAPLIGAATGALGGAVVAPEGHRLSGAVGGAAAGALTGGIGRGLVSKVKGKGFMKGLRRTSTDEALRGAAINTGVSAVANSLAKDKHPAVRTAAPFIDDAVALALALKG